LFDRCATILCRFALSEKPTENYNSIRQLLKSLFSLHLSGTHASAPQRLGVIEKLVYADSEQEQELGLLLLGSALHIGHSFNHYNFDFGARSRDYGYSPTTIDEVKQWFIEVINLSTAVAVSEQPIAVKLRNLLAEKFRGLWEMSSAFDALETMVCSIIEKTAWNQGWRAVRKTINLDAKRMSPDLLSKLRKLESLLKPANLLELARTYVFSDIHIDVEIDESESDAGNNKRELIEQKIIQIGREVAADEAVFKELLPELLSVDVSGSGLLIFAKGLAEGCNDPLAMWDKFRNQLSTVVASQRKDIILSGFLNAISLTHPEIATQILYEAVSDNILGVFFPRLQLAVKVDEVGVERLMQSLNKGLAPVGAYRYLHRTYESISDDNLCGLLRMLASKPDGLSIAVETLQMRLFDNKIEKRTCSGSIISLGQELLVQIDFDRKSEQMDYKLGQIAESCLVGEETAVTATVICRKLAKALSEHKIYSIESPYLLKSLSRQQPQALLDSFFGGIESVRFNEEWLFTDDGSPKLLSHIKDEVIIDWCKVDPSVRYSKIAAFIVAYQHDKEKNSFAWTPLSLVVMDNAPDVVVVLNAFKKRFEPSSWSGSLADIMERGLVLISQLKTHQNQAVSTWARNEEKKFAEEIKQRRQWEEQRNRTEYERFE